MFADLSAITHSTLIGGLFEINQAVGIFEKTTVLHEVLGYVSAFETDAIIVTQDKKAVGILTLRDLTRIVYEYQNCALTIGDYMSTPLKTFQFDQTIAAVLDSMDGSNFDKIVVLKNDNVIGVIDRRVLLSKCYQQITPLIKHEYNVFSSMMDLLDEGEKSLLKLATTDTLTGIGNRRLFEEIFQAHRMLGKRYEVNLFLLLFDIDNFKSINDTFGHNIGDMVLKQISMLVSKSIRKSDVFVRWGGEEFAVLLRYSDPKKVISIAEQLRKLIHKHNFESIVHVTCSFGLSIIRPEDTLEEAVERADKALYRAKSDGKNVVRMELA
ncbi:MAG: diguanylate cyclase [Sulfuricurvum sp.]|nr:diguanylate cyclase [Sulfuricurvum sp.]